MARTSEKHHDDNPFTQCGPYSTVLEPPPLPTPIMRSIGAEVHPGPEPADGDKVMRKVPHTTYQPGMVVINATDPGLQCLDAALDRADLTYVFMNLARDPDIAKTKQFIAVALERIEAAKPNLPWPIYVGLHDVAPERQDAVQRDLVMDGIGGFERDTADAFARRFGANVITPDGKDCKETPRLTKAAKGAASAKSWTRRVDVEQATRRR